MANMSAQSITEAEMQIKHRGVWCETLSYTLNKQEAKGNFSLLLDLHNQMTQSRSSYAWPEYLSLHPGLNLGLFVRGPQKYRFVFPLNNSFPNLWIDCAIPYMTFVLQNEMH